MSDNLSQMVTSILWAILLVLAVTAIPLAAIITTRNQKKAKVDAKRRTSVVEVNMTNQKLWQNLKHEDVEWLESVDPEAKKWLPQSIQGALPACKHCGTKERVSKWRGTELCTKCRYKEACQHCGNRHELVKLSSGTFCAACMNWKTIYPLQITEKKSDGYSDPVMMKLNAYLADYYRYRS